MINISIVGYDSQNIIAIANSIFPFCTDARLNKVIFISQNIISDLIELQTDLIIIDSHFKKFQELSLIREIEKNLTMNQNIVLITSNHYLNTEKNNSNSIFDCISPKDFSFGLRNILFNWSLSRNDLYIIIQNELIHLKFDLNRIGTTYIIDIIQFLYKNNIYDYINFNTYVYPVLSAKYKRTISSIKSSISNSIDEMFYECDILTFSSYFKIYNNVKLKPKDIIYAILFNIYKKNLHQL